MRKRYGPIAASALAFLASLAGALDGFESGAGLPLLFTLRGPEAPPDAAVIIGLDGEGVDEISFIAGRIREAADVPADKAARLSACLDGPAMAEAASMRDVEGMPRAVHACVLQALARAGARGAVYDVYFPETGEPERDAALAQALSEGPPAILLDEIEVVPSGRVAGAVSLSRPAKALREAAEGTGYFVIMRRWGLVLGHAAAVRDHPGAAPAPAIAARRWAGAPAAARAVPKGELFATDLLRFHGPPGAIPRIPFAALVLGDPAAEEAARGRVAFVGAVEPRLREERDAFATPFSSEAHGRHAGVELMATAFLNIVEGGGLARPPPGAEAAAVSLLVFAAAWLALAVGGLPAAAALAVLSALTLAAMLTAFHARLWLPAASFALVIGPATAAACVIGAHRRLAIFVRRVLPGFARRGGGARPAAKRRVTIFFLDVAGSTGLAERLSSGAFQRLMIDVLAEGARAVADAGGEVVKYTGDGLMAAFLARPGEVGDAGHADRACAAARALLAARAGLDGDAPGVRVGIQSGEVRLGYHGDEHRGVIDALGDAVNVAARLQELGKTLFPGERTVVLVGGDTAATVPDGAEGLVPCGRKALRGRSEAVETFRLES